MLRPFKFAAGVIGAVSVPRNQVDSQTVTCGDVRESYCMAPESAEIEMVELMFTVAMFGKVAHQKFIVFPC